MQKKLSDEDKEFLKTYDVKNYYRVSMAADIVIFAVFDEKNDNYRKLPKKALRVLLVKRGELPYKGMYALPGGFVRKGESLDQTAKRELREETGVSCEFLEQFRTTGTVERDPRTRVVSVAYMALLNASEYTLKPGDDASEAEWFTVSMKKDSENMWTLTLNGEKSVLMAKIKQKQKKWSPVAELDVVEDSEQLAFDHAEIIAYAVLQLRKWVKESGIAFRLLPKQFTLKQLQQIHEAVLETKLLTPAFRRKMEDYVEVTDQKTKDDGHRPALLYCEKTNSEGCE